MRARKRCEAGTAFFGGMIVICEELRTVRGCGAKERGYDDAPAMLSRVRALSLFARLLCESIVMIESEMLVTNARSEGVRRNSVTSCRVKV